MTSPSYSFLPWRRLALFGLLTAADFGMTWRLIARGGGAVYESNPVAAWWLQHYGWNGLAIFKLATAALVGLAIVGIWQRRPRLSRALATFACLIVGGVVGYSTYLAVPRDHAQDSDDVAMQRERQQLQAAIDVSLEYRDVLTHVSIELAAGRLALDAAVDQLAATRKAADPEWRAMLSKHFPGLGERGAMAASIVHFTLEQHDGVARRIAGKLRRELKALCGVDAVRQVRALIDLMDRVQEPSAGAAVPPPDPTAVGGMTRLLH